MSDLASLLPHNASDLEQALEQAAAPLASMHAPITTLWDVDTCPSSILPWLAWSLSVDSWSSSWSDATKREVIRASIGVHRRKGTIGSVKDALRAAGYGDAVVIEQNALPRLGSGDAVISVIGADGDVDFWTLPSRDASVVSAGEDGGWIDLEVEDDAVISEDAGIVTLEFGDVSPPAALDSRAMPLGADWELGVTGAHWADYWVEVQVPITAVEASYLASVLKSVAPVRCRLRTIYVAGVQFVLGRDVWALGEEIGLGAVYEQEIVNG